MAHNIETIAWTNDKPWHGLGKEVAGDLTPKQMMRAAGCAWSVEKKPLFLEDGSSIGDQFFALQRDKDGRVLDVVGARYQPVQNEQVFEFFREFTEAGKATMETAGSLQGGRYVWGLAKLGTSFTLRGGDKVDGYMLFSSPHQQGKALVIKLTPIRVVCNNTLTLALREEGRGEWRMSHSSLFSGVKEAEAKEALGIARDQFAEFGDSAKALQKTKLSKEDMVRVLAPVFQRRADVVDLIKNDENLNKPMATILEANFKAPGADPGNAWGLLNAVTYYADHLASRTTDKRMTNAWMGKTAGQKATILKSLTELAA